MTAPTKAPASADEAWPNPIEHAGYVVGGRYRLEERVARGAMGSIWRGRHVELKSAVAIKFLDVAVARETEMHGRFLQEARSTAAVRCAHVVQVFDYGRDENTPPFIVMELLEGETLEQRLERRGVLTPGELDKIFREVACGISRAHATGVVHRDLKPSNIFIASEGPEEVTKLIDFGIAKVDEARLGFTPRAATRAGTVIGTPEYMSPEQLRAGAEVDHSVDLWALGIVAFECLTGKLPFSGNSLTDLAVQICTEKPPAPSAFARVPAGFDRWFAKATNKELGSRFAAATDMAASLSSILQGSTAGSPAQTSAPGTATLRLSRAWVDAGSRLRRALAHWNRVMKSHRLRAWLSPRRAGVLGMTLLGTALGVVFWPVPTPHLPATPVTAQAAPAALEGSASSTSGASPPRSELPASAAAAPASTPELVVRAAAPAAPSSAPAQPNTSPKPRARAQRRQASAARAVASGTGEERLKSAPEHGLPVPVPGQPSRADQIRSVANEANRNLPSSDAEGLFAERL